jgi:GntR family transcriptional repressor for pyruvate dehydrogenase complex
MSERRKAPPLHVKVIQSLQELIENGAYKPGSRLPSERALSERLKVCRNSVREAIRALEVIGVLESHHGEGNIIRCLPSDAIILPAGIGISRENIIEILEARRAIESEAVKLACLRISQEQGEILRCYVEEMKIANCNAGGMAIDAGFHRKMTEFSGNKLLLSYLNSLMRSMDDVRQAEQRDVFSTWKHFSALIDIHSCICESIIKNLPEKAVVGINEYFAMVFRAWSENEVG